jgi:hypothetical protein
LSEVRRAAPKVMRLLKRVYGRTVDGLTKK